MEYTLNVSDSASAQVSDYKKSDIQSYEKIQTFYKELRLHPRTGTGKPELLKGNYSGY